MSQSLRREWHKRAEAGSDRLSLKPMRPLPRNQIQRRKVFPMTMSPDYPEMPHGDQQKQHSWCITVRWGSCDMKWQLISLSRNQMA